MTSQLGLTFMSEVSAVAARIRHDEVMRAYLPLSRSQVDSLISGERLKFEAQGAVAATPEFAITVDSNEPDELDLIAALSASDLGEGPIVGVLEVEAEVIDAELGEVQVTGAFALVDFECLLLADVETQELSWFGVQEGAELLAALERRGS